MQKDYTLQPIKQITQVKTPRHASGHDQDVAVQLLIKRCAQHVCQALYQGLCNCAFHMHHPWALVEQAWETIDVLL